MSGAITSEDFMSSGSGSPIAYGVLEQGFRKEFSLDEARKLAEAAVRAAMERDPGSGNGVDVFVIPNGHSLEGNGWQRQWDGWPSSTTRKAGPSQSNRSSWR